MLLKEGLISTIEICGSVSDCVVVSFLILFDSFYSLNASKRRSFGLFCSINKSPDSMYFVMCSSVGY